MLGWPGPRLNPDLTALVLVFPDEADPPGYDVLCWFWSAHDGLSQRADRDRAPYPLSEADMEAQLEQPSEIVAKPAELRAWRKRLGLTQAQAAQALGGLARLDLFG